MLNQTAPPPLSRGLIRILGVGFGLAVIVGSTLGIGILRTPGMVAGQLPDITAILAVWITGGLYTLVGAVCLAELGTMLPAAGGYYVYARRAFGDAVGFGVGWTDWLTYCSVLGYVSIAIGEFTALLVPALAGYEKPIAILTLAALAALQLAGLRVSSRFQEVATLVKSAAFLVVVVAAIAWAPGFPSGSPSALPPPSFAGLIVALQSVVITYGGWQSALYFSDEDRDPNRNLPRSMIGGVASVIVVYLLVNVALLLVLPLGDLARSTLPAADAAQILLGSQGREIITILSIVSLPPMLNAILMIGTRILFAMGRDGLLWRRAASVTARGTPAAAMLATTAVALVLIATGTFQRLVAVVAFFLAGNYVVCCLALFVLRRREPNLKRPFRAWGYPWSAVVVLAGAAAFLVGAAAGDTRNAIGAVALLALGLVIRVLAPTSALRPRQGAIAILLVLAGSHQYTAQVVIPPAASLDVQIPSAPIPVVVGGQAHLAYELHITNFRAVDVALTRIDVLGDENPVPLASYRDADLSGGLARAGARPDQSDKRVVGGGQRVVFFVWLAQTGGAPSVLRHTISFDVLVPSGAEPGTVKGGQIAVRGETPVALDPPLRDGPWIAVYEPSMNGGHRRALFAINGKARIPARFAIDWIKLGADGRTSRGDASVLSNWAGYGEEVLAVADGVVADAVDRFPEPTRPITLDNSAGNLVTLELGGGRFASYEHLKPGSVRVKTGDRVHRGQVIALLGGSGSVSSGPHLHFHVSDGNSSLGAEGLPFVFKQFERLGAYDSIQAMASGEPWVARPGGQESAVRMEMPRQQTVLRF